MGSSLLVLRLLIALALLAAFAVSALPSPPERTQAAQDQGAQSLAHAQSLLNAALNNN